MVNPFWINRSRPARGEWIEIHGLSFQHLQQVSRPARGEWIEIGIAGKKKSGPADLAPHGASGLKCKMQIAHVSPLLSRPARGEWIEISTSRPAMSATLVSRPARGEWIEMLKVLFLPGVGEWIEMTWRRSSWAASPSSRPARGEWIEMGMPGGGQGFRPGLAPHGASGLK